MGPAPRMHLQVSLRSIVRLNWTLQCAPEQTLSIFQSNSILDNLTYFQTVQDSNCAPSALQADAIPIELSWLDYFFYQMLSSLSMS